MSLPQRRSFDDGHGDGGLEPQGIPVKSMATFLYTSPRACQGPLFLSSMCPCPISATLTISTLRSIFEVLRYAPRILRRATLGPLHSYFTYAFGSHVDTRSARA